MTPEHAKIVAEQFLALMEREFDATCKVLAAVKDENRDYKPDEKSRSAWDLATHMATADVWFLDSISRGKFEWDPDGAARQTAMFKSVSDVVTFYKKELRARIQSLHAASGDELARSVDFFGRLQLPAAAMLGFANNHSIHHRGQLAAYLRGLGSKVPAIYGASADEPMA
ncbi:MAG: DinB family protein [Vicinamibacterales bacterium]